MLGRQLPDPPAAVPDGEKRDDLEHPLAVARPLVGVDVFHVAELAEARPGQPRLLGDLAQGCLLAGRARLDVALWKRPGAGFVPAGTDRSHPPATLHPADEHSSGRELAAHPEFVTRGGRGLRPGPPSHVEWLGTLTVRVPRIAT